MREHENPNCSPVEPERDCTSAVGGMGTTAACRMSARDALTAEASRLRRKVNELEALARQIPDGWPSSADEALWQLVMDQRR